MYQRCHKVRARARKLSLRFLFRNVDFSFVWKPVMLRYHLRGRSYNAKAMFKALLLKEMRQISSRRQLVMFLRKNKFWLKECGFEVAPHHDTFSKFIKRVGPSAIEELFYHLVRRFGELREIGEIVAVDSTQIKGYTRDLAYKVCSDPDARWGYSATRNWVFGYKLHIACDVQSELPIAFTVTSANVYDSKEYPYILEILAQKGIKPKIIVADAGYDTKENYALTLKQGAIPIIALNKRNLKKKKIRDFEIGLPIQRNTLNWKNLYRRRGAVERVISRLKEELNLKNVKVRGLDNVKVHATTSLIAMLCVAIVALQTGNGDKIASINTFKW